MDTYASGVYLFYKCNMHTTCSNVYTTHIYLVLQATVRYIEHIVCVGCLLWQYVYPHFVNCSCLISLIYSWKMVICLTAPTTTKTQKKYKKKNFINNNRERWWKVKESGLTFLLLSIYHAMQCGYSTA